MKKPGVIFDRDGTLIDVLRDEETGAIYTAFHPSHLRYAPHAEAALKLLHDAGFTLAVATNQPGVAKGHFSRAAVARTHEAMAAHFEAAGAPLAAIEACLHHPEGGQGGDASLQGPCDCRKPKPGLLTRLIAQLELDPARTWMVGDALSDVQAARAAGVHAALVRPDNRCEACPLSSLSEPVRAGSLLDLCSFIASQGVSHANHR